MVENISNEAVIGATGKSWDQWHRILKKASILQIRVIPVSSKKTTISFHQEKLKDQKVREKMRAPWKEVLKKFSEL